MTAITDRLTSMADELEQSSRAALSEPTRQKMLSDAAVLRKASALLTEAQAHLSADMENLRAAVECEK